MKSRTPEPAHAHSTSQAGAPPFAFLLALVVFSGSAALVYELLWFRQLGLVFGNTAQAAATVLAAFMIGLAWGAGRARRWAVRSPNPLRLFGALEAGIGLYALIVPAAFSAASAGYVLAAQHLSHAIPLLTALRFAMALLVLIVPTTLMGASLPVLSEAAVRSRDRFAERLGLLYGSNTAGATLGVLACGFWMLPAMGVRATNWLAAAINLAVGLGAWYASRRSARAVSPPPAQPIATGTKRPLALPAAAALCGFLALAFETVWFRALVLIFGSTSHSFAIMVSGFLVGIAIGAAASGRWLDQPHRAAWALAASQAGIGLWTLASIRLYDAAPEQLLRMLVVFDFSWPGMLAAKAAIAAVFLVPIAVLSGIAFTAVVRLVRDRASSTGQAVGATFGANSIGSAAGAVAAGFALLPSLGIERTLLALGWAAALLGLAVAWRATAAARSRRLAFAALVLAAMALARAGHPGWDPLILSSGAYFSPRTHVDGRRVALRDRLRSVELVFFREGATATIAVTRTPDGRLHFTSDGKVEADTSPHSMVLQRMMGHIPMLLHPAPSRVLNIGLGAGVTSGALACYPGVRLEVAEIEPVVTNVAALWGPLNHGLMRRESLSLVFNDGRNHLLVATGRYDVITSDPFEPVVAGAANLYSVDHFRLARSRLAPGGLMAQFLPLYELSRDDLLVILRSFLQVFPRSAVFFTGSDTILLGLGDGAELRLAAAAAKFGDPAICASLAEIGIDRPERLLDMMLMEFEPGGGAVPAGPVNTDDHPIIEFSAPRSALEYQPDANRQVLLASFGDIPARHLSGLAPEAAAEARRGHAALRTLLQAGLLRSSGDTARCVELLRQAAREAPQSPIIRNALTEALSVLAWEAQTAGRLQDAMKWYAAILRENETDFWALHNIAQLALRTEQTDLARTHIDRGLAAHPRAPLLLALRARLLGSSGEIGAACRDLQAALARLPLRWDLWEEYASLLDQADRASEADAARASARHARRW